MKIQAFIKFARSFLLKMDFTQNSEFLLQNFYNETYSMKESSYNTYVSIVTTVQ